MLLPCEPNWCQDVQLQHSSHLPTERGRLVRKVLGKWISYSAPFIAYNLSWLKLQIWTWKYIEHHTLKLQTREYCFQVKGIKYSFRTHFIIVPFRVYFCRYMIIWLTTYLYPLIFGWHSFWDLVGWHLNEILSAILNRLKMVCISQYVRCTCNITSTN